MRTRILIAVTAVALITGCATGPEDASGPAQSGEYTVVAVSGAAPSHVDTGVISLHLATGTLTAGTGCNTITGRTRLDGDRLTVSDLSTTDLPCTEAFVAAQRWLTAFLESGPTVTADGDLLTLATAQTTIQLRRTSLTTPPGSGPPPTAPRTA